MGIETNQPPKTQIRNFLLVVFLGVSSGALLVFLLVHYFGPSGRYDAKNVLLAPNVAEQMDYNDHNPVTGADSRYVFKHAELSVPDPKIKKMSTVILDHADYQKAYDIIAKDVSFATPPEEVVIFFDSSNYATLTLTVKTNSPAKWQEDTKVFQEMQILTEYPYYRIQLHEDQKGIHWVYFYHPDIYQQITRIIKKPS